MALWFRPVFYLGRNLVTLAGAVLTTSSAVTLLGYWAFEIVKVGTIPAYAGIIFYLILPAIFVIGLLLIPIGALWHRHKLRVSGELPEIYPQVDFRDPQLRYALGLVVFATCLNVVILGIASYRGVSYMDTTQFCGQTCHSVMAPEFTAYQNSPHASVDCVACHIGPGAGWFVRSKLSGARQVFAVALKTYSRPIPSPVAHLRPARETCEQCHWPERFTGDKFLVKKKFTDDEKNTPLTTVLVMKIGGRSWQGSVGIHGRHLDLRARIRYVSMDPQRQVIPVVYSTDDSGKAIEYVSSDVKTTPLQLAQGEQRTMDCVDCHNRPTHAFEMPDAAVDQRLSDSLISTQLPYIKKKAVELLKADYPDQDTARQRIVNEVNHFYRTSYPQVYRERRTLVQQSAEQVAAIYTRNVFPTMRLTWGSHPNNLGHQDFPGCFRCHDGSHSSADGLTITNDCSACHAILAMEDPNPKVLTELEMK